MKTRLPVGRDFTETELDLIREVVALFPKLNRAVFRVGNLQLKRLTDGNLPAMTQAR
ncbi:MAG TPA: hypothetical protein GX507_08135 [Clostridia bacterium]|nr:hypothetical protein [Clostridia bacterium]